MTTDIVNITAINSAHLKYNQLLVAGLSVPICQEFRKLRLHAIEETKDDPKNMLTTLRSYLRETKSWNQDIIDTHCISVKSYCQNLLRGKISLDRLIETSLVSTAKIMGAPRIGKPKGQVELDIPDSSEFVKDAFVRCASELHSRDNIVLCTNKATKHEQARNEKSIRKLVKNCVEEFILTSIPLEEILDNITDESDMVDEAKHILEDAKEEVKLGTRKEEHGEEAKLGNNERKVEGSDGEEHGSDGEEDGMPSIGDKVPDNREFQEEGGEIKSLAVKHTDEEEDDRDLIEKKIEREKKGYYDEDDHGFFSDSDLDDGSESEESDGEYESEEE